MFNVYDGNFEHCMVNCKYQGFLGYAASTAYVGSHRNCTHRIGQIIAILNMYT